MEIAIRPFTMADYEGVRQLWQLCHLELGPQESQEAVQRKLKRDPDLFLLAEANHQVMGVVMGAWDGCNGWVYNHAVDPRSRRLGLGRRLIAELERRLRAKGATQISLVVSKSNFEALDFYETLGFRTREEEAVMVKSLATSTEEVKGV